MEILERRSRAGGYARLTAATSGRWNHGEPDKVVCNALYCHWGRLSGLLGGSNLGPVRLDFEFGRSQLEWVGAFCGLGVALLGCCLATEYQKACDRNRAYVRQLKRLTQMRFES